MKRAAYRRWKAPIVVNGKEFMTVQEAAEHFGCSRSNITASLVYGFRVGVKKETGGFPITIRGVSYPTHQEAARCLGVSSAAISNAKRNGYIDKVGLGLRAPKGKK